MLIFANHYYNFGFNITHISPERNFVHKIGETLLKSPSHYWEKFLTNRQQLSELHELDWRQAIGIGTVLGFNNLRALDIDECNDIELINDFLKLLGLPKNYQWVTLSGSRNGFHIIFYSQPHRYKTEIGKIKAFKSNAMFNDKFKHIELRWIGHLVLPPSLHPSLNKYEFLFNSIPFEKPKNVEVNSIENLINKYCSNKAPLNKPINSLYVDTNAEDLEEVFDTITSGVYVDTNAEDLEEVFDTSTSGVYIDITSNINVPYYFFFDTETTGIPVNWKAPVTNLSNWPRIVQIAYIICDENGNEIEFDNYIVKPDGFIIPEEASNIHGITTEKALKNGVPLKSVLEKIHNLISKSKSLVAHNINFDEKILGAEFLRNGKENIINDKIKLCTMEKSINFCAIDGFYGYKWPKLSELYFKLFKDNFEEAHNATVDVRAMAKCFWELKKIGIM